MVLVPPELDLEVDIRMQGYGVSDQFKWKHETGNVILKSLLSIHMVSNWMELISLGNSGKQHGKHASNSTYVTGAAGIGRHQLPPLWAAELSSTSNLLCSSCQGLSEAEWAAAAWESTFEKKNKHVQTVGSQAERVQWQRPEQHGQASKGSKSSLTRGKITGTRVTLKRTPGN